MWHAPECLVGVTALAKHYHEVETLFTGALEVYDACANDIAEQLDLNADRIDEVENIKALLKALSVRLANGTDTIEYLDHCTRIRIFPVRRPDGALDLATAVDDTWFIADERRYEKCFQGTVALLDYAMQDVPELVPLLDVLGIAQKRLSRSMAEEVIIPAGVSTLHSVLTAELQSKAEYISLQVFPHNEIPSLTRSPANLSQTGAC